MAGLLAVFAEFEREILRERTKAGVAHAWANGKRLGRLATAAVHAAEIQKLDRAGLQQIRDRPADRDGTDFGAAYSRRKEASMSSPSIEFHKVWINQCAAAEDIRESLQNALDYLIGEKLLPS